MDQTNGNDTSCCAGRDTSCCAGRDASCCAGNDASCCAGVSCNGQTLAYTIFGMTPFPSRMSIFEMPSPLISVAVETALRS